MVMTAKQKRAQLAGELADEWESEDDARIYEDASRRVIEVAITLNNRWCSMRRGASIYSHHRLKSKYLPLRATRAEAQADLDKYAQRCKLVERRGALPVMDVAKIAGQVSALVDRLHLRMTSESHYQALNGLDADGCAEVLKLAAWTSPKDDAGRPQVTVEIISQARRDYTKLKLIDEAIRKEKA